MNRSRLDVLQAIQDYRDAQGWPPAFTDITALTGHRSPNTVRFHVYTLEAEGLVRFEPGQGRTVRLTEEGRALLARSIRRDWRETARMWRLTAKGMEATS